MYQGRKNIEEVTKNSPQGELDGLEQLQGHGEFILLEGGEGMGISLMLGRMGESAMGLWDEELWNDQWASGAEASLRKQYHSGTSGPPGPSRRAHCHTDGCQMLLSWLVGDGEKTKEALRPGGGLEGR
ncbi:hypothetical protein LIER_04748 [Lithospermum erythrorhizon]|uniref:Uncharacterized protein n=1 Tax=Lithospermum erythrorhizon TaxID=34254 RepID=A0AAV3NZR6_LITER